MFSDHMRKIDNAGGRTLLIIAAALVITCQLVAMAMVADGQVKKAELRETNLTLQRVAMARCMEANPRADRESCLQQASADATRQTVATSYVSTATESAGEVPARRWSATQGNTFGATSQGTRGLMSVAFN